MKLSNYFGEFLLKKVRLIKYNNKTKTQGLVLSNQNIDEFCSYDNPKEIIQSFARFFKKETSKNSASSRSI